jgi:hypothetical protein
MTMGFPMPARRARRKMLATAMRALRLPSSLHRSLAWLLWLAMLVPVAQSAAGWHAYSHAASEASGHEDGKPSPRAAHCDLCLNAAGVSSGVLPGVRPSLAVSTARFGLPQAPAASVWLAPSPLAYRSRAPPHFPL